MSETDWLGIIAVAGFLGTLLAPIIAERMRRRSARDDRLMTERTAAYTDVMFEVVGIYARQRIREDGVQIVEDVDALAVRLDRVMSRAEIIASRTVASALRDYIDAVVALRTWVSDNPDATEAQYEGSPVAAVEKAYQHVRDAIRAEVGSDRAPRRRVHG